jgi:hypothetical protein
MTFDPENQSGSSSHDGDQLYRDVWSWRLWFRLYPAYKAFQLSNALSLTFDFWPSLTNNYRVLPLMMVIKYNKLNGPVAYGSVSILPTKFFN